jgi:dehydrogenase/reductase SDR family protein 12
MLCRNEEKGNEAIKDLEKEIPRERLKLYRVDVSKPQDIIDFVNNYDKEVGSLDCLINNAAVIPDKRNVDSETGLETTFATNSFGAYLLATLLMRKISGIARIINVSSGGMLTQNLNQENLQNEANQFNGLSAYARTKRQLVEIGHYWAEKFPNIHFASVHPGWVDTPGVKGSMPGFYKRFKGNLRTVEQGADSIVWAAISKEALNLPSGAFIGNRKVETEHLPLVKTQVTKEERLNFITKLDQFVERFTTNQ